MQQQTVRQNAKKQRAKRMISNSAPIGSCLFLAVGLLVILLLSLLLLAISSVNPHIPLWVLACLLVPLFFVLNVSGWHVIVYPYLGMMEDRKREWLRHYGVLVTVQIDTCEADSDFEAGGTMYTSYVHSLPSPEQSAVLRFVIHQGPYEVGQFLQVWIDSEDLSFYFVDHSPGH